MNELSTITTLLVALINRTGCGVIDGLSALQSAAAKKEDSYMISAIGEIKIAYHFGEIEFEIKGS